MKLEDLKSIHFLGIGGIGMSALARYLHSRGKVISGYDKTKTEITEQLEADGIMVSYRPDPAQIHWVDMMIRTPAVPVSHLEYLEAEKLGVPILKRAQVLGMISQSYRAVGIAGTHGKTSTTGLTTHLLRAAGIDATGFVGGITRNYDSNYIPGESDWVVIEADEFDRSFLWLEPEIAVVTSMDPDHLDIYGQADEITKSFRDYAEKIKPGGTLFLQERLTAKMGEVSSATHSYGIDKGAAKVLNLRTEGLKSIFDYEGPKGSLKGLELNLPGRYNVENATAAISVALEIGGNPEGIREGLRTFKGIKRRFDIRHNSGEVVYIDDYAHHPEEIRAVIGAVRDMLPGHRLVAAFQPHLFSRTNDFHEGFAETLSLADAVLLLDIYPAREEPMPGVTSQLIFDRLTVEDKVLTTLDGVVGEIEKRKGSPVAILTIGAGDIDTKVKAIEKMVAEWT